MQRGGDQLPQEAIVQWLFHEMEYNPTPEGHGRNNSSRTPSSIRYLVRGNLIPVWQFFLTHVRNKKHVHEVKKNLAVHLQGKWLEAAGLLEDQEDDAVLSELEQLSREQKVKGEKGEKGGGLSVNRVDNTGNEQGSRERGGLNGQSGEDSSGFLFGEVEGGKRGTTGELLNKNLKGVKGKQKVLSVNQAVRDQKAIEVESLRQEVKKMEEKIYGRKEELSKEAANKFVVTDKAAEDRAQVEILKAYDQRCRGLLSLLEAYQERLVKHAERGVKRSNGRRSNGDFVIAGIPGIDGPVQMDPGWFTTPSKDIGERGSQLSTEMEKRVTSACSSIIDELQKRFSGADDDLGKLFSELPSSESSKTDVISREVHQNQLFKGSNLRTVSSLKGRPEMGLDLNKGFIHKGSEDRKSAFDSEANLQKPGLELKEFFAGIPGDFSGDYEMMVQQPDEFIRALSNVCTDLAQKVRSEVENMDPAKDSQDIIKQFEVERRGQPLSLSNPVSERLRRGGLRGRLRFEDSGEIIERLIRELRMAHVKQFQETQAAIQKTREFESQCEELVHSLTQKIKGDSGNDTKDGDQNTGKNDSFSQELQLALWALQREVAGRRAAKSAMAEEAERLRRECKKRQKVKAELADKWREVQQFDEKKAKLQQAANNLNRSIQAIAASWEDRLWEAQDYCMSRVVPSGASLRKTLSQARDLIGREVEAIEDLPQGLWLPMDTLSEFSQISEGKERTEGAVLRMGAASRDLLIGSNKAPAVLVKLGQVLAFVHSPTKSFASLLPSLAREFEEEEHLLSVKDRWETMAVQSKASLVELGRRVDLCSEAVQVLEKEMEEVWVPKLKGAIELGSNNLTKAAEIEQELMEYWEQPGGYAVTWVTLKDAKGQEKNVTEWLSTVQNLSSRLRPRDRHFSRTPSSSS